MSASSRSAPVVPCLTADCAAFFDNDDFAIVLKIRKLPEKKLPIQIPEKFQIVWFNGKSF